MPPGRQAAKHNNFLYKGAEGEYSLARAAQVDTCKMFKGARRSFAWSR